MVLQTMTDAMGNYLWGLLPRNSGPIRESFESHAQARFEFRATTFAYGALGGYCVFSLLR